MNRVCCGAVDLSGIIHGEAVFKMNTTTSCGWLQINLQKQWDLQEKYHCMWNASRRFCKNCYAKSKKVRRIQSFCYLYRLRLRISASEHDQNDSPYQAATNNVKIHCQRPAKAGGQQLPLCAQLQLSAHPSGRTGHLAPGCQRHAAQPFHSWHQSAQHDRPVGAEAFTVKMERRSVRRRSGVPKL